MACSEASRESSPPPSHEVVKIEEPSFGNVRRLVYRIQLPEHYDRSSVEEIARWRVQELVRQGEAFNAISMLFYGPDTDTSGAYDVASIDWAPDGDWSKADTVDAGDYRSFRFTVRYTPVLSAGPNAVEQDDTSPGLSASGNTGLFGIPLPEGSRLAGRTEGDPAAGIDTRERYMLKGASAVDILGFFASEMPRAGWQKTGPATPSALFFKKGDTMVGVLTNQEGGSFTLMGS